MKDEEMADKYAEEYVMCEDTITENDRVPFDNGYGFQTVSFENEVKKGYKDGFFAGLKAGRPQWHLTKNELPELQTATDTGDEYNTLVLCFWYHTDSRGKKTKIYDLDRWYPENDIWESGKQRDEVEAWMYLPEPPEEI